jgi:hypothetical protein
LYYTASDQQIKSYDDALVAAGWTQSELLGRGGFVSNGSGSVTIYCRKGSPAITTSVNGEPQHFLISISSGKASDAVCSGGNFMSVIKTLSPSVDAPLPSLRAPQGATMQAEFPTAALGRTGARITSSSGVQTLLDAFAAQFVSAGWTAGSKASANGIAMQTFSYTGKKRNWECALSIYAVAGKSGEYLASVQPTDLSAP